MQSHNMEMEIEIPKVEIKEYARWGHRIRFGRSSITIQCPFCLSEVEAFIWSLAGSGKKCPGCGAIHGASGRTYKYQQKPKKERKKAAK